MAGIGTAIQLTDQMTGPLNSMANALYMTISAFEEMQSACDSSFDASNFSAARDELDKVLMVTNEIEEQINQAEQQQEGFNKSIRDGTGYAEDMGGKIQSYIGAFALLKTGKKAFSWVGESLEFADTQLNSERQLAVVLRNVGAADDALDQLKDKAAEISGYSLYGDELMIGGAGELASYINDVEAIETAMGTLANYMTGMSGGGEISYQQAVDYATQLGKALDGTYDGLTKKGFVLSEAQKEIIENGTDMEKALVLDEVISQSWAGLAENMANMPQGKIIQFKNAWADVREEIGAKLYPAVIGLMESINQNMPQIESIVQGIASAIQVVIYIMSELIQIAGQVYNFITENWSMIAPLVYGIAAALAVYQAVMLASAVAKGIATAAQWALNAAMSANPVMLIVIAVIALIGAFYALIGAMNDLRGTTTSATGMIAGAFVSLLAFTYNSFVVPFINSISMLVNFFANVFNDPVASIKILFYDLVTTVIGYFANMASAIESVINKIPGVTVDITSGIDNFYNKLKEASQAVKDESGWVEVVGAVDYWDYGDAYNTGYSFGEGIEEKIKSFDPSSLFDYELPDTSALSGMGDVPDYLEEIADNTGAMKNSLDITSEDLKYLKDLAEAEAVNRFTMAEIKLDVTNNNNINNTGDLDGIVESLTEEVMEALLMGAEGVHI